MVTIRGEISLECDISHNNLPSEEAVIISHNILPSAPGLVQPKLCDDRTKNAVDPLAVLMMEVGVDVGRK